ncbi:MAG: cytochrome ubiquinol oxidase subunit I [Bacillota bacterium]
MDVALLSRIQFAVTVGFHFLFPPITIGLAWLLLVVETLGWRTGQPVYGNIGRFFAKLLGLTFAVGVATGVVMEFQFGTNWARYSKFVGDIFGAPLAAEAIFAFFLESVFLGLYLFARDRISRKLHWFSILMVAIGSTLSAFWIIVANSWMQTPAGFTITPLRPDIPAYVPGMCIDPALYRAELTNFWQAVFNPSTIIRYVHTVTASVVCGAFFMAGAAAYILLRSTRKADPSQPTGPAVIALAQRALGISLLVGLVFSIMVAFPSGHHHAKQIARLQKEKFAAIEGLYTTQSGGRPLVMFALPFTEPPHLKARIEIPNMLSLMAFGDINAHIPGIDQFPKENIPPLWLTFVSFHNMVALGMLFIAAATFGTVEYYRGALFGKRGFLWLLVCMVPLPLAACQFGWVVAEVGRQPWIVYGLMRTSDAFSANLSAGQVLFSLLLFSSIYLALLALYFKVLFHKLHHVPATLAPTPTPPTLAHP